MENKDVKITYLENLMIIEYLTKSLEDKLILYAPFLKYLLLVVDLPLNFVVFILNLERYIYNLILGNITPYIKYDTNILIVGISQILHALNLPTIFFNKNKTKTYYEEEIEHVAQERSIIGKIFYFVRFMLSILWALFIFILIFPFIPLVILYNLLKETIIVLFFYYLLIFHISPDNIVNIILYIFVFLSVTFIVSSISVPFILRIFIYIKHLFSLDRKTFLEINNEAKKSFINLYMKIQKSDKIDINLQEIEKKEAEGGLYYLFLKIIHKIKDIIFNFKLKKIKEIVFKIKNEKESLYKEYEDEKTTYIENLNKLSTIDILKCISALLITFLISASFVSRGLAGQGFIGPILLAFIDKEQAIMFLNYFQIGKGYYTGLFNISFLPGFIRSIGWLLDYVIFNFFVLFHTYMPYIIDFFKNYYINLFNLFK